VLDDFSSKYEQNFITENVKMFSLFCSVLHNTIITSQQMVTLQEKTACQRCPVSSWARTQCCPLLDLHEWYFYVLFSWCRV